MVRLLKIYGERNTNTNYLSKLIQLNLDVRELYGVVPSVIKKLQKILPGRELVRDFYFYLTYAQNLGWKHSKVKSVELLRELPIVKSNKIAFITITKNPYSWLLSLYRNPYHQYYSKKPDFEDFLQSPWKTVARDNTRKILSSPVELWNIKNLSYLALSQLDGLNITTESIFENPGAIIEEIHTKFSIKKKASLFINHEKSLKDMDKDTNYYRDYYMQEKWKDELSKNAIAIINNAVDKLLMSKFGYNVLS